jgi:hypothetical protein
MKLLMSVLAIVALGLTLIPSFFVFTGDIDLDLHTKLMTIGTILWFIAAPIWFKKEKQA